MSFNHILRAGWMYILLLCGAAAYGQTVLITQFYAESKDGKAYLRWKLPAGNTCYGINVYRSADQKNYTLIHEILGVCGSNDSATSYEYTDNNPEANRTNYYQLEPGNSGYRVSGSVFVISAAGIAIYPQPAQHNTTIYFVNSNRDEALLTIRDANGNKIMQQTNRTGQIDIDCSKWAAGVYNYVLQLPDKTEKGRLTVTH